MLSFEEFKRYVENHLEEYLPQQYKNASIGIQDVQKNNGLVLAGLTVLPIGHNIAPTVYLNKYYDEYLQGEQMEYILQDISSTACKHMCPQEFSNVAIDFQNFDYVKDRVVMVAVNREMNEELLSKVPHQNFEDLAIIYKVVVGSDRTDLSTITICNQHLNFWDASVTELHELAMKNTRELLPVKVQSMKEVMMQEVLKDGLDPEIVEQAFEMMNIEEQMFVISNKQQIHGAVNMMYDDVLLDIAEKVGTDLYIIPSSVHECIAVSCDVISAESLAEMVHEVNADCVSDEEVLSNHVYRFNAQERTLTLADASVEELGLMAAEGGQEYGTKQENVEAVRPRRHR